MFWRHIDKAQFHKWEYYLAIWLEELAKGLSLTVDYATNFDVHKDTRYTENYKLFISVGHDEYWSKEELV